MTHAALVHSNIIEDKCSTAVMHHCCLATLLPMHHCCPATTSRQVQQLSCIAVALQQSIADTCSTAVMHHCCPATSSACPAIPQNAAA